MAAPAIFLPHVGQTREAYDRSKDALEASIATFERSLDAAGWGAAAFNHKIVDIARGMGTQLREYESGFRYTPTTTFETFPFPRPSDEQREAFRQTIADFQGIQWEIAKLATKIEAARLLTYRSAWLADQGKFTKEWVPYLSMAKYYATELAVKASNLALQMLGADGD